jgi:isopentenyl phosphate kinase
LIRNPDVDYTSHSRILKYDEEYDHNLLQTTHDDETLNIILIKIGGSSITDKSTKETLNSTALSWFGRTISQHISDRYKKSTSNEYGSSTKINMDGATSIDESKSVPKRNAYIIVHGAGSFGHHTAKEYGLKGGNIRKMNEDSEPSLNESGCFRTPNEGKEIKSIQRRRKPQQQENYLLHGIAQTRLSVQKLNNAVVEALLQHNVNAVGISPCFAIQDIDPSGFRNAASEKEFYNSVLYQTIEAGMVPVLHGDACLTLPPSRYDDIDHDVGGILSGDTLMEIIGKAPYINSSIFVTDVDGVFTLDPKTNPNAQLVRTISVDSRTGTINELSTIDATGSTHKHDVTGGLQVRYYFFEKYEQGLFSDYPHSYLFVLLH